MMTPPPSVVGVRFEGGLGDHILGMRVLRFVRRRFPQAAIVGYSDASGSDVQRDVIELSPFVSCVKCVFKKEGLSIVPREMGRFEHIREQCVEEMLRHPLIDTYGELMFVPASQALGIPIFTLLAEHPRIKIPTLAFATASRVLPGLAGRVLIGVNFQKYGIGVLRMYQHVIEGFIRELLTLSRNVVILNFWQTAATFSHWPEPAATIRCEQARQEAEFARELCELDPRIIPCCDAHIHTVAALLSQCRYFIGVDNGVKHLAWALNIPHTVLFPHSLNMRHVLRWLPDLHRVLPCNCTKDEFRSHVEYALECIKRCSKGQVAQ